MKIEFDPSCQSCDNRSVCEVAGQKGQRLEESARELGSTVTQGSVLCLGKEARPEPWDPACGAKIIPPTLASEEERQRIASLNKLDYQAAHLIDETRQLIKEIVGI